MDATMQAAIAEINATRRMPPVRRGSVLGRARESRDVAYAQAREVLEAAVQRAQGNAERARRAADRDWAMAQSQARAVAVERAERWRRIHAIDDTDQGADRVRAVYDGCVYMLTPQYAVYLDRAERAELPTRIRMLATELRRRGVEVS